MRALHAPESAREAALEAGEVTSARFRARALPARLATAILPRKRDIARDRPQG